MKPAPAHVLIPVKRLDAAKTRLSAVLGADERAALMHELVASVVAAVRTAGIERITLVTSEQLYVAGAARWDDRGLAWNDALLAAMQEVVAGPVAAIVSADLPLLGSDDVLALIDATPERGLAIARATDGGTNAISMRPPAALRTCFGRSQSARLHGELARAAGLEYTVLDLPGLAFDLDTPEDLERLRAAA